MDYQDCDAKIKIHLFSIEYSSLTRSMLLDPMMEELKLIVVEKYEFKNIAVVDNLYGIFSRPQIGSEEKHTLTSHAGLAARASQETNKYCHHF